MSECLKLKLNTISSVCQNVEPPKILMSLDGLKQYDHFGKLFDRSC